MAKGNIRTVSKRKGGVLPTAFETVIEIDRSNPVLGNPVVLQDHRDTKARAAVIQEHQQQVDQDLAVQGPVYRALKALADRVAAGEFIALRCWCAPRPCHGDYYCKVIRDLAGLPPAPESAKEPEQTSLF